MRRYVACVWGGTNNAGGCSWGRGTERDNDIGTTSRSAEMRGDAEINELSKSIEQGSESRFNGCAILCCAELTKVNVENTNVTKDSIHGSRP